MTGQGHDAEAVIGHFIVIQVLRLVFAQSFVARHLHIILFFLLFDVSVLHAAGRVLRLQQ